MPTNDLHIKRSDGLDVLDSYLKNPATYSKSLVIPNDLSLAGGIGVSVSFCQFLLTWARKSNQRIIKTFLDDGESQEAFASRVHGLCASYFSFRLLSKENKDIRQSVLVAARPRIEAMSRGDLVKTARGREIELIFIENAINEFHGSVYTRAPNEFEKNDRELHSSLVRSYREINRFLELCFEELNIKNLVEKHIARTDYIFGRLLSEVFHNTIEHAYSEVDGTKLDKNLRCIKVSAQAIDRDKICLASVSSPTNQIAAKAYFSALANARQPTSKVPRSQIRILELSVFDSGPGFVKTIAQRAIDDRPLERMAVAKCFRKHQSAKGSLQFGRGLGNVIELVNELEGFLRVRTSSAEAFYTAGMKPDMDPEDFVAGNLPKVEGTVVTIGIPIQY
ncbi:ATP-binding protein [Prosthecobacter sp.]|jgi:hypothetical protein|uniref:ATP-binding protein n=1 Tax=Prosthecobacter sp. TaxID=1965333 RepID=UPI0037C89BCE